MRLRPVRDDELGVPDLQSMFYATPLLAEFYGYVQAMYENKNVTAPCHEGERAHPRYNLNVLRDTVLAAFLTEGVVCPGRQALEVIVAKRRAWLIDQVVQLWARLIPAVPNFHESLDAFFSEPGRAPDPWGGAHTSTGH